MAFELTVPRVSPGLNVLMRMHWRTRMKLVRDWRKEMWLELAQKGQLRQYPFPKARIEIHRRGKQLIDTDNLSPCCKFILDALKDLLILEDDDPPHCELVVTQSVGRPPQTTIRIEGI